MLLKNEEYMPKAIEIISKAQEKINISTFKLERNEKPKGRKSMEIFPKLVAALERNVKIRILVHWNPERRGVPKTNFSAGKWLAEKGIDVRFLTGERCCHAKIISVDKKIAIIGSHNWSIRSLCANFEMSLLTESQKEIQRIDEIFETTFTGAARM